MTNNSSNHLKQKLSKQDAETYLEQLKDIAVKEKTSSGFEKKINALIISLEQPSLNLEFLYSIMFPSAQQETARVQFTNFKNELNKLAESHQIDFILEVDTRRKLALNEKLCWFNGAPLQGKRADNYNQAVSQVLHQSTPINPRVRVDRYNIFVSVATDDFEIVDTLLHNTQKFLSMHRLDKEVKFWLFKHELRMGENFDNEIQQAIKTCDFGILALSQHFFASQYIKNFELPWFVPQDNNPIKASKYASPILIRDLDFSKHDLRGIADIQIFRGTIETPYIELEKTAEKDKWAEQLAEQIADHINNKLKHDSQNNTQPSLKATIVNDSLSALSLCFTDTNQYKEYAREEFIKTRAIQSNIGETPKNLSDNQGIDALEHLEQWACDPDSRPYCALLGEYGMGKTFTSMMFAERLAKKRQTDTETPVTYYLDLRRFSEGYDLKQQKHPELKEILNTTLKRSYHAEGETPDSEEIINNVREHGALIIFDGLDEVMVHLDDAQNNAFIRQLWAILPPLLSDSSNSDNNDKQNKNRGKVMLTCRSHFFSSIKQEANMLMGQQREGISKETYFALTLLPFTKKQIHEYFSKNLPDTNPNEVMDLLASVHNLSDLAQRPYSLNLISSQMQKLEQQRESGETIWAINLYQNLIEEWVQRDQGKHQFDPAHKPRLMEALAAELWKRGTRQLPFTKVADWLDDYFIQHPALAGAYANKERTLLKEDLRTATFITRPDSENFQFAHSSLAEFFLASHLYKSLENGDLNEWEIALPSQETLEFLGQLFAQSNSEKSRIALTHLLENDTNEKKHKTNCLARQLAFRFWLLCKQHHYTVEQPKNFDLSQCDLSNLSINQTDPVSGSVSSPISSQKPTQTLYLNNCDFSHANLSGACFHQVHFKRVNFNHANAFKAEFHGCDLNQAQFENTNLIASIWRDCKLTQADLQHGSITSSQWIRPELTDTKLSKQFKQQSYFIDPYYSTTQAQVENQAKSQTVNQAEPPPPPTRPLATTTHLNIGHSGPVFSVAFNHDCSRLLSGSYADSLKLWDAQSGDCLLTLKGHSGPVNSVAFNHDGSRLLSGSGDNSLKLWDAQSGDCLLTLKGHSGPVFSVAFNHDGSRLLSGADDNSLKLWDAQSGDCLLTLKGHSGWVSSVAFNHDGSRLLSGSHDNSLKLWDAQSGDCLLTLKGHSDWVSSVAFNHDGSRLLSGSIDNSLKLWDAQSGDCLKTFVHLPKQESVTIVHKTGSHKTGDKTTDDYCWASAGAWRYLAWHHIDKETGAKQFLLGESFGRLGKG